MEKQKSVAGTTQSCSVHNCHIEIRIILLHVLRPVLLPELLDHRLDSLGIGYRHYPEFRLHASRINPNRRVGKYVPVPLCLRALHGEQVQLLAFEHEPDGDRDCFLPIHADFDLAVAGEAGIEAVHGAIPFLVTDTIVKRHPASAEPQIPLDAQKRR
jgi:hypothetical protein